MKKLSIIIALVWSFAGIAQQTPAPKQTEAITVTGVTAHIGNGTVIDNCSIVFENGKITAIGSSVTTKGKTIDAAGKHIYPGFIAPGKSLGLVEVNAVRASDDSDEIGNLIPHVRSIIAYNAESKVVESMRPNGVLLGQITPKGGRISGTSSIVQFDAWNWEDATVKADDGIHLNWPNSFRRGRWWLAVLVNFTHTLPNFEDDDYDFTFKLPKLLVDAGLLVGLQNASASNFQTRNLPFYAGQVVAQGLDKEKALQLISGNTAKILGIDADYGTLEVGKSATFLCVPTN